LERKVFLKPHSVLDFNETSTRALTFLHRRGRSAAAIHRIGRTARIGHVGDSLLFLMARPVC